MAHLLLNTSRTALRPAKRVRVIVKDDQKSVFEQEILPNSENETPAHLSFRRLAISEFSVESEGEPLRFYYRGHTKHFRAGSAT